MEHICIIVAGYPTKNDPQYAFIKPVVDSLVDLGIKCSVIAPQSATKIMLKKQLKRPIFWQDKTSQGNGIDIYQPKFLSFSKLKLLGFSISNLFENRAIKRTFAKLSKPTILYGHFWRSGMSAAALEQKIPVFVASGESKITVQHSYSKRFIQKYKASITGVIFVSRKNKVESLELGLVSHHTRTTVIPNAINNAIFYQQNKQAARKKLGFNEDDFIVVFTGAFSDRKGVMRLSEAIGDHDEIKSIFIGKGKLKPVCNGILFSGPLAHNEIVHYLNCADVFVLPTLAEGCCNAIIEAMACGLPIVSSDLPFNDDILTEANSIRINSHDIQQIKDAIHLLKADETLRNKMSVASLETSKELEITTRVQKILTFMKESKGRQ